MLTIQIKAGCICGIHIKSSLWPGNALTSNGTWQSAGTVLSTKPVLLIMKFLLLAMILAIVFEQLTPF